MKRIGKSVVVFIFTAFVCIGLSVLTALIPRSAIQNNCQESAAYFKTRELFPTYIEGQTNTTLDYYADCILLNIIYCIDSQQPLESVIRAKYYNRENTNVNEGLMEEVYKQCQPNVDYSRYWHGSMVLLRPLLVVFNVRGIYRCIAFIMYTILFVTFLWLICKRYYKEMLCYLIGICVIQLGVTTHCIEYSMTMLQMSIMVWMFLRFEKKGNEYLYFLAVICGVLTCFLDFLTTETLTITVPLFMVMCIRKADRRLNEWKKEAIFGSSVLGFWGISYVGMFFLKWVSAILAEGIESFTIALEQMGYRIGGNPAKALYSNVLMIFPFDEGVTEYFKWGSFVFALLILGVTVIMLLHKSVSGFVQERGMAMVSIVLLLIPYVRYVVLSSHSQQHSFFTYRAQLITVMVIVYQLIERFVIKKDAVIN